MSDPPSVELKRGVTESRNSALRRLLVARVVLVGVLQALYWVLKLFLLLKDG